MSARHFAFSFAVLFVALGGLTFHHAFADQVVATIPIGTAGLGQIGVNPQTNMIYVSNIGAHNLGPGSTVTVIDGSTNTVVDTIKVLPNPYYLAVNPNTNLVYVPSGSMESLDTINGSSDRVANTIHLGGYPNTIAVNPNTNMIYIDNGTLQVIDGSTNQVVDTIKMDNPKSPGIGNMAVNSDTDKIYVANYGYTRADNTITVIDGSTNTISATIPVGQSPTSKIAVNPVTDKIYVANDTDVVVIDGSTNTVTDKISGITADAGIAVNPVTDKIYAVDSSGNTTSVIDGNTDTITSTISGLS